MNEEICVWQSEKLPTPVLVLVFRYLFKQRCFCGKWCAEEVRNDDLINCQFVCRKWAKAWRRLILTCIRQPVAFPLCFRPLQCLNRYQNSKPRLPFLDLHRLQGRMWRKEAERREASRSGVPLREVAELDALQLGVMQ